MQTELIQFYSNDYDETGRLLKDKAHRIEFLTTMDVLKRFIQPGACILDCCAGAGAYAFALAAEGHDVTACDLVPALVDQMKERQKKEPLLTDIRVADAQDLSSFPDNRFDVVLCMGALYHLADEKERAQAVRECVRVLKPGGLFAGAYVNKHAQLLSGLMKKGADRLDFLMDIVQKGTSSLGGPSGRLFYRTDPQTVEREMTQAHLKKIVHVGTDGIGYSVKEVIESMTEVQYQKWVQYHLAHCTDEYLLGYSLHGLYIGEKQK